MQNLPPKLNRLFEEAYSKIKSGELKTLIPFLSLLKVNGKPMTLERHYQFAPMFSTLHPLKTCWMCGRQSGKSHSLSASSILQSALIPGFHQMIIQPRSDQIQRLNGTTYVPLLKSCAILPYIIKSIESNRLALKTFLNGSLTYMDSAFLTADRVRGAANISLLYIDEVQDVEYEIVPILEETMSASINWGFSNYTGTPKTTDTCLALLWGRSSQAEWVIRCDACNYFNIPNPEHDLIKMIGQHGPICAKCGRPLDISHGGYVHAYPSRARTFAGFHSSQTIHPLHCINDAKWGRLLEKVRTYDQLTLWNECFGWPYDAATSPLTLQDLINAEYDATDRDGHIIDVQKPSDVLKVADNYSYITVGCDWSGGGMLTDSYTAFAVVGLRKDNQSIDILYGERIPKGLTPTDEANIIMSWIRGANANAFAFDNGGAGFVRTEIMKHQGLLNVPGLAVVPIMYSGPRGGDIMSISKATREYDFTYFSLEKSRSLAMCIAAIKQRRLRFPRFKHDDPDAYARDFLALREDPRTTRSNDTVIIIIKRPGLPDDFSHAVNFACNQIYDRFGAYLQIGKKYDTTGFALDENHKAILEDEVFGPRGDFDRFAEACHMEPAVITPDYDDFF